MTGGGAAAPEPFDLSEVGRSGDLLDALAARRGTDPTAGSPGCDDPAVRLLAALIADVDAGAPPLPATGRLTRAVPTSSRSVVRAFVTFGAATLMLTTAGVAIAGAGGGHEGRAAERPAARIDISERSIVHRGPVPRPAFPGGRTPPETEGTDEAGRRTTASPLPTPRAVAKGTTPGPRPTPHDPPEEHLGPQEPGEEEPDSPEPTPASPEPLIQPQVPPSAGPTDPTPIPPRRPFPVRRPRPRR